MAKHKKTEDQVDVDGVAVLTDKVNWEELAKFNDTKATEALALVTKLEDFIASVLPDLRVSAKYLNSLQVEAGIRMERAYKTGRDLLGARGEQLDRAIRGV